MKIIFATSEQFYRVWNILPPQNRILVNISTPNMFMPFIDTLLLLNEGVDLGSITGRIKELDLKAFIEIVRKREYDPIGGKIGPYRSIEDRITEQCSAPIKYDKEKA
jgi:hypothetical protein